MTRLRTSWLPWMILAVSLGITWQAWDRERRIAQRDLQAHFEDSTREVISRIEQRMAAYELLLRGLQAQYMATGRADRDMLRGYVGAIQSDANFTGILAIGFANWVPANRKEAHVAAMRRQGFADYRIRPDGTRDGYAPVDQRMPDSGRDSLPSGFDPWSDPVRRQAMERARDSGMAAVSGKVQLVVDQDAEEHPGFLMYLPVYERGRPVDNMTQRRAALIGWYLGSFRMSDLMASLYGPPPPGIALAIHDGIDLSDASLLYRSEAGSAAPAGSVMSSDEYLMVGGHTWTLTMTATSEFVARFGRHDAPLIAWSGIGLSLALALIAWLLVGSEARAQALAESMTQDLRESERRWAFALEGAGDGVWDWNLRTRAVTTSKRWKEIVGCDTECVATIDDWEARVHPDDRAKVVAAMESIRGTLREGSSAYVAEYRVRCQGDRWKWILARGMVAEQSADGLPLRMIGTISDIDERKSTEELMRHMAQHDPLTDLPNRALFSDLVQRELAHAARHNERFALIFLDLDRFKPVNDNYGHSVGDQLLRATAKRIRDSLRAEDTVGRIGGDEFVILVSRLQKSADALALADKIRDAIRRPFEIDQLTISISCSLGVAVYPQDGKDEIALAKHADYAMYAAKDAGGDRARLSEDVTDWP